MTPLNKITKILYILVLVFCFVSNVFRPDIFLVSILVSLFYFLLDYSKLTHKIKIPLRVLLWSFAFFILFISIFNYRYVSIDGLQLYLKNALLVKDHSSINFYDLPPYPYFVEFVLGILLRYFGDFVVNVSFGVVFLLCIYTSYLIYLNLGVSSFVRKWSLAVLVFSPCVIALFLVEFKVDLFLLLFSNLLFLILFSFMKTPSWWKVYVFGVLAALGALTKALFLPLSGLVLCLFFIEIITQTKSRLKLFNYSFGLVMSFMLVMGIWIYFNGVYFRPYLSFGKYFLPPSSNLLTLDTKLQQECVDQSVRDHTSEMFPDRTILDLLTQPFYYLSNRTADGQDYTATYFNPGAIIYISIILSALLFPLLFVLKKNRKNVYIYLYILGALVVYYALNRTTYWYLLPIFPFISLLLPILVEKYKNNAHLFLAFKYLMVSYFSVGMLMFISYLIRIDYPVFSTDSYTKQVYTMNIFLDKLAGDKLILLASEPRYNVHITFLPTNDTRVIPSRFYFYASGKNIDQIYTELKSKNIAYILAKKPVLFNSWYKGCRLQNNIILNDFLDKYTIRVDSPDHRGEIFQLL